ncbi:MAG: response regulator [Thermodesulfobacteriota bacterium]|nr:response regulator [Thermodesulfobacteriota bacterium]
MVSEKLSVQDGIKQVLIVDNNQELLESLKVGLEKYREQFSTLYANDGKKALEILKHEPVSAVVSDIRMPKMNGLALLSSMTGQYPDIPVIIITAYGQDELEWLSRKSGAVAFVSKPFSVDEIGNKILSLLQKESDGGVIKGISVGVFMQLAEMEEMTCTIRVYSKTVDMQGVVFFKKGKLYDARYGSFDGEEAIVKIISLEQTHIRIQNSCPDLVESRIGVGLQAVLLEAMRLKDEAASDKTENSEKDLRELSKRNEITVTSSKQPSVPEEKVVNHKNGRPVKVLHDIQKEIGKSFGSSQVDSDHGWEHTVTLALKIGDIFNAGRLKCGYIQKNGNDSNLFIPGSPSAVLRVEQTCPRDRVFRIAERIG